jgi:hypothetical protein|tara:strand:+ start:415 stop:603 length:189 start_codon:yes stop_codon:yes gene_type:complete
MGKVKEWLMEKEEKDLYLYKKKDDLTAVKLIDAIKDSDVIKQFNKSYKEKFGKPSIFDDGDK